MALETKSVRVVRAFYFDGKPQKVDSVITLPKVFAMEMVAANKAEYASALPPASSKPARSQEVGGEGGQNAR